MHSALHNALHIALHGASYLALDLALVGRLAVAGEDRLGNVEALYHLGHA